MAKAARSKKPEEAEVEANLIPIMSCMFLLIPALLLAMEVARHGAVPVSPPHTTVTPGKTAPTKKVDKFSVKIRSDGFSTANGEVSPEVDIPVLGVDQGHDYPTLAARAASLHAAAPERFTVYLSAEGDVTLQTVVETMDALRGEDCSLRGALMGERAGRDCNFWNVVIES